MSSGLQRAWAVVGVIAMSLYLLDLGAGIFELIPDNIPVVGNLDEVGATLLLVKCIMILRRRRTPPP